MTISLRLSNEDSEIIRACAALNGVSVSDLVRRAVMERIEDEYDLKIYARAKEAYLQDPTTYSLEEVERELGIDGIQN